jgi:signal transduction histidine kinase
VTEERTTDERRDFADRTVVGWHVLFYALVVVAGVVLTAQGHGVVALPVLMLLALAYALIGVPAYYRGDRRGVLIYVAISYLALGALCSLDESALILLFALYPQAFLLLERRWAIGAATALTAVFTVVALLSDGWDSAELSWRLLLAAGNLAFALVIGLFIDGIIRESTRRKELVEELRAAQASLAAAERDAGAAAERERLARDIHDGVLQVLALVRRRGGELPRDELAHLAGEQEVALRRLITSTPEPRPDGTVDLCSRLAGALPARASLAVPAEPVLLPAADADELVAVLREAAANAATHAGADAGLWVLVEDDDAGVTVSVRDDGVGIAAGRVDEAAAEGHLGVASSMRGRVAALGGTISLHTAPGEGTEWEIRVPRSLRSRDS